MVAMTPATNTTVRAPQVAGRFYPHGDNACIDLLERYLSGARPSGGVDAKVMVAPHAGWVFSGPVAGTAYAAFLPKAGQITRVVLLGPAHRVPFRGIATTSADGWATPLGTLPVDWDALRTALSVPGVAVTDEAFVEEHSLEVHAPFIQRVFPNAAIVPLLVGDAPAPLVSAVVERLWGGPETLIVVSSDLSHFHDQATAQAIDAETAGSIEALRSEKINGHGACGHRALAGVLDQARRRDLRATALDLRTSADTRGNPERVVGYGAFALEYAYSARLPDADRQRLVEAARFGVRFGIEHGRPPRIQLGAGLSPTLTARRASFVTLTLDGRLRGCIGSMAAHRPLLIDVADNAWKAAFGDRRFPALTVEELDRLDVSVSILSVPHPVAFENEADLVRQVRPDVDGLVLQDGDRRGIFLPSVWSGIPKAAAFVTQLKRKAGLPADHWSDTLRVFRYTTESFGATFQETP
jgi:AmmeMemoRadiSam system protein B/AmmeMemoRadiSam system protein A